MYEPILLLIIYLNTPYVWIALRFFYISHSAKQQFFFTSNSSENWLRDFLALGFFLVPYAPTAIGMFSIFPSVVETMASSKIDLYWCWSSHLPEDLYNFVIFPKTFVHAEQCYLNIGLTQLWPYVLSFIRIERTLY